MKPLKLILAAVLGIAITIVGYSAEQKKEKKVRSRQITVTGIVTDINNKPISFVKITCPNVPEFNGSATLGAGTYSLFCNSTDTLAFEKEGYITKIIPVNGRYEIDIVLEKIPEDLLPAKDSTEKE